MKVLQQVQYLVNGHVECGYRLIADDEFFKDSARKMQMRWR